MIDEKRSSCCNTAVNNEGADRLSSRGNGLPAKGSDRSPCSGTQVSELKTGGAPCCDTGLPKAGTVQAPCCGASAAQGSVQKKSADTVSDSMPVTVSNVSRKLSLVDVVSNWKLRWGIGRMKATVTPALYRAGSPGPDSPVLVTANYRMSFDALRTSMPGRSFWILVLNTYGINVWCAAGKGTFGTEELIQRVRAVGLERVVKHRTLIVPQLGAPGVKAHEVQKQTRFKVVYGPVRAADLNTFLDNGLKADETMRTVEFSLKERAVLAPMELVQSLKSLLIIIPYVLLFHLLRNGSITVAVLPEVIMYIGSLLAGTVAAPLLLPWLPGRAFAVKGWILGLVYTAAIVLVYGLLSVNGTGEPASSMVVSGPLSAATLLLLLPAISAFFTMNFTGTTTYTSLSGVKKEMRYTVPAIIGSIAAGTVLNILRIFL